jgi:hypothetical protein
MPLEPSEIDSAKHELRVVRFITEHERADAARD